MQHRNEIDGLRAIAVVPVVLFHAGFGSFAGGFVGVDVFFVISGYLITSILIDDLRQDRFSLARFYERRARRILPALYVVMGVCIPFAWLFMLPHQMEDFGKSLIATVLFLSNVLFWREAAYFAPAAEEKPLLHTWSLAVEEQYYLLFPLFLWLVWRTGRTRVLWILVVLSLGSLLASEWGARANPTANFYLAPTRAWELLAGSICAFLPLQRGRWADVLAFIGLALIVLAVATFDDGTPFPSLYALIPVGGTVLVILCAHSGGQTARVLCWSPMVGIGLISYSIYLWHQPLFAFARLASISAPSGAVMAALSLASVVLGYLSWRFVENPFRRRPVPLLADRSRVFAASIAGGIAIALAGSVAVGTGGLPNRYSQQERELIAGFADHEVALEVYDLGRCFIDYGQPPSDLERFGCLGGFGQEHVILFGDSHGAHLLHGLSLLAGDTTFDSLHQYTGTSCRPFHHSANSTRCRRFLDGFHDAVRDKPGTRIIVSANWSGTLRAVGEEAFAEGARAGMKALLDIGHQPVIIGQSPTFEHIGWLKISLRAGAVPESLFEIPEDHEDLNAILRGIAAELDIPFLDPLAHLCRDTVSGQECATVLDGQPLYFDSAHLSLAGSELVGRAILNAGLLDSR